MSGGFCDDCGNPINIGGGLVSDGKHCDPCTTRRAKQHEDFVKDERLMPGQNPPNQPRVPHVVLHEPSAEDRIRSRQNLKASLKDVATLRRKQDEKLRQEGRDEVRKEPKIGLTPEKAEEAREAVREEGRQEVWAIVNSAHTKDFIEAVKLEAVHQRKRWPVKHDTEKAAADWMFLIGWLAGKAVHAAVLGDKTKALHHTISSAAVLLNWHAHLTGLPDAGAGFTVQPPEGD